MQPAKSEELLRLLIERVEDYALFVLTPDGRVATWNPGAARIKGYKADEIVGSHFSRFYRPEEVAAGKCEMELAEAARVGRFEDEGWRVRRDGSEFWANVVITALRDESGRLVGYAKITRDLTARRQKEQDERRLAQARAAERAAATLQAISTAFAGALTRTAVADVIATHVVPAVGADGGDLWVRPPLTDAPTELNEPIFLESSASIPLVMRGETIGILGLTRSVPASFSPADRTLALTLANQCALAVDRALAFERELEGKRRANFLAQSSTSFSSSLDVEAIALELARLAVPMLGDWCAVELIDGEGFREVATVPVDPAKAAFARELRRPNPPDPATAGQVVRTGELLVYTTITDAGPRSGVIVPLRSRNETIGVATFVWSESERHYAADDLDTVSALCGRAALAMENARLYQELQKAVRARDDFMSIAGHELRTPLSAIMLILQTTERLLAKLDDREIARLLRERLAKGQHNAARLERLIARLLDARRLTERGLQLEPEAFDLGELVRAVVSGMTEVATRSGSELRCEIAPSVIGNWDRLRLEQVVSNLVANALKYGLGKPVTVRVQDDGDFAALEVEDNGIGIAPAEHGRIFERFERAVSERHFAGLGLGLWISRQIVEASGGTIDVRSSPGAGSGFFVRLPKNREGTAT